MKHPCAAEHPIGPEECHLPMGHDGPHQWALTDGTLTRMATEHTQGTAAFVSPERKQWHFVVWDDGQVECSGEMGSLEEWWLTDTISQYEGFGPKLAEYGAHDLEEHGRLIARLAGRPDGSMPGGYYGELGCLVYLHGKLARAMEAYQRGDFPSDDTLHDIEVYAKMARAYRHRGGLSD